MRKRLNICNIVAKDTQSTSNRKGTTDKPDLRNILQYFCNLNCPDHANKGEA
jgi:hypothetical protein